MENGILGLTIQSSQHCGANGKNPMGNLHSQPKTIWQRRRTGPSTVRKRAGHGSTENRYYHNRTIRRAKEGKLSKLQLAQYPINPAEIDLDARMENQRFQERFVKSKTRDFLQNRFSLLLESCVVEVILYYYYYYCSNDIINRKKRKKRSRGKVYYYYYIFY